MKNVKIEVLVLNEQRKPIHKMTYSDKVQDASAVLYYIDYFRNQDNLAILDINVSDEEEK